LLKRTRDIVYVEVALDQTLEKDEVLVQRLLKQYLIYFAISGEIEFNDALEGTLKQ
jgi:hypothetical protein